MSEAAPAIPVQNEPPINVKITNELKNKYKEILIKHLNGRLFKEDKIYSWINNILLDAKEYFITKYPDYDLFLYSYICPKNVYFTSKCYSISIQNIDWVDFVHFSTDNLYSVLYFFFYKHYNLDYSLEENESEIIQKGNEILIKYLEDRKYDKDKCNKYSRDINNEHIDFILTKDNKFRTFFLNEIYKNPIQNKYFYKYLTYGKEIYSKIIQTYSNDYLTCCHYVFFFK